MNVRYIASLAVLLLFLSLPFAHATAVTVDIYGTNVSNAQSNLTKTGNNSYEVVQWAVNDSTKSIKADNNGNVSGDDITFTLHNFTAWRVIEVKVNSTSYNAYQADGTGTISFKRTQTVRNQTYAFTPAVNAAGYNFTWGFFDKFSSRIGAVVYADQYPTIQDAINASDADGDGDADYEIYVPCGTYAAFQITKNNSKIRGGGIGCTVINDTTTAKLPGNSDYGAAIFGFNYNSTNRSLMSNITISDMTVIPNTNNVGIALAGTDTFKIYNIDVNMIRGYKAIDFESSSNGDIYSITVSAPRNRTYYNYGIGSGLAGVSAYQGSYDVKIHDSTVMNITGDSFLVNSGDENINIHHNYAKPSSNTVVGQFDAFVDIEGQAQHGAVNIKFDSNIFQTYGDATTAPNGFLIGGNGHRWAAISFTDNTVDNSLCSTANCQVNGFGAAGTNISNGVFSLNNNLFLLVGNIQQDTTVRAQHINIRNNFANLIATASFVAYPTANVEMTVTENTLEAGNMFAAGGTLQSNADFAQNYGAPGFFHGNRTTPPAIASSSDTYFNFTKLSMCLYTTSWQFMNNTGTC